MFNWFAFAIVSIVAYALISAFGQLGGGSGTSALDAALATFKPLPFVLLLAGNILWGVAIYYGLRVTREAIPAAISFGVVTSFIYSTVALGAPVTLLRAVGVVVILSGIYLLQ